MQKLVLYSCNSVISWWKCLKPIWRLILIIYQILLKTIPNLVMNKNSWDLLSYPTKHCTIKSFYPLIVPYWLVSHITYRYPRERKFQLEWDQLRHWMGTKSDYCSNNVPTYTTNYYYLSSLNPISIEAMLLMHIIHTLPP